MLSVEVGEKLGYLYPPQLLGIHHWFLSCSLPEILQHRLVGPDLAARIRVPVIMIGITNRKTRICHNRKVDLLYKRFLTLCFLVQSEFVAAGQSFCISNCIITVDMAPSKSSDEPFDSVSHKMLHSSLQMIILFIQFLKDKKNIFCRTLIGLRIFTSSVDKFLQLRMAAD